MKVIYLTDVHGSFVRVYNLLKETVADLYIVSGDLLDMPFYSLDVSVAYFELQGHLSAVRAREGARDVVLEDFARDYADRGGAASDLREKCERYLAMTEEARESMLRKYRVLNNIFSSKPHAAIYTIPGNYDMDLRYTQLRDRTLHLSRAKWDGLTIAGYGGADVLTPGFPEKYLVRYRGRSEQDTGSELYKFLLDSAPDIILAHHPASGVLDRIGLHGSWGSVPLRSYCDTHDVILCLTGHLHQQWGLRLVEKTLYLNPSNFGEVLTPAGNLSEGGFFYELEIDGREIPKVVFRKIVQQRVYDIAVYERETGGFRERIVDEARLESLKRLEPAETTMERYAQVPELRIFRDIRNFFRIRQTEQSEMRVRRLEEALAGLGPDSERVAADIVGSVNMGTAGESSDIDMVLYVRGYESCGTDETCSFLDGVERRLREDLGERCPFQVIDRINLTEVEECVRAGRRDCEAAQRFAVYRSFCRPANYRVIAPAEDLLNKDPDFRREVEENMRAYLRLFATAPANRESLDKYTNRLKTQGVPIPQSILRRIELYLSGAEPPRDAGTGA